jgi:hypothetical protein
MTSVGHEERFPPTGLSAGYGFRKETIAGMRRNGRDAPLPVIRCGRGQGVSPTQLRHWPRGFGASAT